MANPRLASAFEIGCNLHAFRSGGGLRVIRLEKGDKLFGYGEHPNVEDALRIAGEDFEAGGRPYDKVYGPIETPYWTGSSSPSSDLDAWVLQGQTFDARPTPEGILVELVGYEDQPHPPAVMEAAKLAAVEWEARGFRFRTSPAGRFATGEPAISTEVIGMPEGATSNDAFHYRVSKQGVAATLEEAVALALAAPPVEIWRTNVQA